MEEKGGSRDRNFWFSPMGVRNLLISGSFRYDAIMNHEQRYLSNEIKINVGGIIPGNS
ncbi:MAG: hypothetical protein ABR515_05285 [Nitrososphaeraceae archaeon]